MKKSLQTHSPQSEYIDVHPSCLERLDLGLFAAEEQIPTYQFDCIPDIPDTIGISLNKTEMDEGEIMAMYHIQNYGLETIRVFPRKLLADEAEG